MAIIGRLATGAVGLLFGGGGGSKQTPASPATPGIVTRNAAVEAAARSDALAKRRGTVASMINGARGAEAPSASKTKLGL